MNREQLLLTILNCLDNGDMLSVDDFNMELGELTNVFLSMQKDGLIQNVAPLYADNKVYFLDMERISLATNGIDYLKRLPQEVQKNILQTLHDNRFSGSLSISKIRKKIFLNFHKREIEAYLKILKDKGYVIIETKKAFHNKETKFAPVAESEYRISEQGAIFVENGFEETIDHSIAANVYSISGSQINIASDQATIIATQKNGINYEELDNLVEIIKSLLSDSLPTEISGNISESIDVLHKELNEEAPKKSIIKGSLNKLLKALPYAASAVKLTEALLNIIRFAIDVL